jgi:DTW domain-containing protein YfiP
MRHCSGGIDVAGGSFEWTLRTSAWLFECLGFARPALACQVVKLALYPVALTMLTTTLPGDAGVPADRDAAPQRRLRCTRCLLAASTCLCAWVAPVASAVELLILQHPLEVGSAKGSARLLHLCVPGSTLVCGETFDAAALDALINAPGRIPVLLFPQTPDEHSLGLAPAQPVTGAVLGQPSRLRLVVLDGTWRKTRKMLYLNPLLQALPRLSLQGMPASHYRIRKAHAPDQLSTLEAAAYALAQIENDSEKFRPLLAAFDGFVDMFAQRQARGDSKNPLANGA